MAAIVTKLLNIRPDPPHDTPDWSFMDRHQKSKGGNCIRIAAFSALPFVIT
jgi:hypothetical protein